VEKSRIMGLDVGEARIGVAVSDPTRTIAQPLSVVGRRDVDSDARLVCDIAGENRISLVVVGFPLTLGGKEGAQAQRVTAFAEKLEALGLEVVMWDERMTTKMAEGVLLEAGVSRRDRKELSDKVAAVLILQSYLDYLHENSADETSI